MSGGGAVWHRKTRGNGWLRANEWIGGPDRGFHTILEEIAIKNRVNESQTIMQILKANCDILVRFCELSIVTDIDSGGQIRVLRVRSERQHFSPESDPWDFLDMRRCQRKIRHIFRDGRRMAYFSGPDFPNSAYFPF